MKIVRFSASVLALMGLSSASMAVLPTVTADPNVSTGAALATPAASAPVETRIMVAPAQPIIFMNGTRPMVNPVATQAAATSAPVTLSGSTPTATAVNDQITPRILASIVTRDAQGQEVLTPVTSQTNLVSGNIIEYRGYITNTSPERVNSMKVTLDIPARMELTGLADMAPERPYGSIDGSKFQYMPLKANIGGVVQEIPMSYYKAVQWDIKGLGLNEVAMVKFRARVK